MRVALEIWRSDSALRIPVSALFRDGSDWAAFAIVDGRAQRRIVGIGRLNNETGEVFGGLEEGETVIVFPSDRIADGALVEALRQ